MRKAQSSLEFVLLVSFALLIGSSFLYVVQQNLASTQKDKDEARVMQLINLIETEFVLAEKSPEGYKRTFLLPSSIDGVDYEIRGTDGLYNDIVVTYKENNFIYFIPNALTIKYGVENLKKGENNIYKQCTTFSCEINVNT